MQAASLRFEILHRFPDPAITCSGCRSQMAVRSWLGRTFSVVLERFLCRQR
jgi:hypothetical protein